MAAAFVSKAAPIISQVAQLASNAHKSPFTLH
jgi:hypothetical protein